MLELPRDFLTGALTPVVTPFRAGAVDLAAFGRLVEFQLDHGSHGVVVTGTSGEPSVLTVAERVDLFDRAMTAARGRGTVIAATGAATLADTLELTRAAADLDVDAAMVVTPYYSKPSESGVIEYYRAVSGATDLPVLIYHIPGRSGLTVAPATIERIATDCPTVVGVKHSAYDLLWLTEVISRLGPEFRALVGVEELSFPMLAIGAAGLVNAAGNVAPGMVRALYDAVRTGDLVQGRRLHHELFELNSAVFWETNPGPIKYLMARLGLLESDEHRLPLTTPTARVRDRLDDLLSRRSILFEA